MASVPIYGKNHLKISFSRTKKPKTKKASRLDLSIQQLGLKVCQVCSNDDPRLTFFTVMSNLRLYGENIENTVPQNVRLMAVTYNV